MSAVSALRGGIRRIRSIAASMWNGSLLALFFLPAHHPPLVDPSLISSLLLLLLLLLRRRRLPLHSLRFRCFRPNSVGRPSTSCSCASPMVFPFQSLLLSFLDRSLISVCCLCHQTAFFLRFKIGLQDMVAKPNYGLPSTISLIFFKKKKIHVKKSPNLSDVLI